MKHLFRSISEAEQAGVRFVSLTTREDSQHKQQEDYWASRPKMSSRIDGRERDTPMSVSTRAKKKGWAR